MLVVAVCLWVVPARVLCWRDVPWLLLYPLVYLVYVFARGEMVGLYPYPFIDVLVLGYGAALLNSIGLFAAYALAAGVFVGLKSALARQA